VSRVVTRVPWVQHLVSVLFFFTVTNYVLTMERALDDSLLKRHVSPLSLTERTERTACWVQAIERDQCSLMRDDEWAEVDVGETELRVREYSAEVGVWTCLCGSMGDLLRVLCCEFPCMACGCCGDEKNDRD